MKNKFLLLAMMAMAICALLCSCKPNSQKLIVGKWYCVSYQCKIDWVEFKKDGILIDADGKAYDYKISDDDLILSTKSTSVALKIESLTETELVLFRDNERMTFRHTQNVIEPINNIDSTDGVAEDICENETNDKLTPNACCPSQTNDFCGIRMSQSRETMQSVFSALGFVEEGVEFQPRGGGYGCDIYYYKGNYWGLLGLRVGLECDGYDDSKLEDNIVELPNAESSKKMLSMLQRKYGKYKDMKENENVEYRWSLPNYTLLFVQFNSSNKKDLLHIVF